MLLMFLQDPLFLYSIIQVVSAATIGCARYVCPPFQYRPPNRCVKINCKTVAEEN